MVLMKIVGTYPQKLHHQPDSKLLDLANQFKKGRGLTIVTSFVEGSYSISNENQKRAKAGEIVNCILY